MYSIKKWAEDFAKYTWERLGFVHNNQHARLHETTITDELIFQISQSFKSQDLLYILEHAKDEKRNGNDLEFAIGIGEDKYLLFPTQAKRIYVNQKYPRISHKGQMEGLISYANEVGGIPLYLLYNFSPNHFAHPHSLYEKTICREHYGCTLVRADHIRANYAYARKRNDKSVWIIPTFSSLHPEYSFPWHLLFHNPYHFLYSGKSSSSEMDIDFPIQFYTQKELLEDSNWQGITSVVQQESGITVYANDFSDLLFHETNDSPFFSPRFRLIINP